MAAEVEAGQLDRGRAAVAGQLLNYAVASLRTELKAQEIEELVPRIEAVERRKELWG